MAIEIKTLPILPGQIGTPVHGLVDTTSGLAMVELGEFAAIDVPDANDTYTAGDAQLMRRGSGIVSIPYTQPEPRVEQVATSSTTRALAPADDRKSIRMTGASAALTIPLDAGTDFAAGFIASGSMVAGGTITGAAGVTVNGVSGGSVEIATEALGERFRIERVGLNAWVVSGMGALVTGAQFVDVLTAAASDVTLGPTLGAALATALASLDVDTRNALLVGLFTGIVGDGEAVMLSDDGVSMEGLVLSAGIEATQADVLAGDDTEKVVTAAAAGGFYTQHSIAYASTLTIDFTGDTPAWGERNVVAVTGPVTLDAAAFPAYMAGRAFTVRFVRESGTGDVTLADGAAAIEYYGGLSSADIPALGTDDGDWIEINGKVASPGTWHVTGVASGADTFSISGGTITTPTGYRVAAFTTSGTLDITGSGTLNYEIVAGGGGAGDPTTGTGGARGGGGGAGEIKRGSLAVTGGSYAITVGTGGAFISQAPGGDGEASSAFGITAAGGGGGGGGNSLALSNGRPGGSGGGAAGWSGVTTPEGGASTAAGGGLGSEGGDGSLSGTSGDRRGGGGGGAGGVGAAATNAGSTGNGGAGSASICPGVSATYAIGGNGYLGVTPSLPTAPGSGGHAGLSVGSGTAGAAGIVRVWMAV